MAKKTTKCVPILKVGEYDPEGGGGAYIYFDEDLGIPGFDSSKIRFEFADDNSFEKAEEIRKILKASGFQFVVQK